MLRLAGIITAAQRSALGREFTLNIQCLTQLRVTSVVSAGGDAAVRLAR